MMDWFKEQTPAAKILIVLGLFTVVLLLIFSQVSRGGEPEPQPTATPPTSGSNSSPGGGSDPSEGEVTEEPVESTPEPAPELPQETDLPIEEQQAAMDTGIKGFLEYYNMSADEPSEARQQRMAPYFDTSSEVFNESPLGDMISTDDELKIYSEAFINFTEPIGGSADQFYVLVGATVRGQITPPEGSGELPFIQKSTMVIFEVSLTKQAEGWKINDITEK